MNHPILLRRLWHETKEGFARVEQRALVGYREPLIVLGEPGMGKTQLLDWLGKQPGYAFCTARQLKNARPDARRLIGDAATLVVDALDELSVRGEGDAVDLVLQKLGDIGYPPFVLSCRVADWRNATGVSAIREQYGEVGLLVLHLEPLTPAEIHQLLAAHLAGSAAEADIVIAHLRKAGLEGLLANPQTLELVARVARAGPLPDTKTQLFERAVNLLRRDHRDGKADLQPDEATALDAAGAAFAALILTGSDALVVEAAEPADDEIQLAEASALPGARRLEAVLGSRLFGAAGVANRFTYGHRRIGEFLGSRWLARRADTALKRKRLLALFQAYGVVPASLRGLHAWLAHHDRALAPLVIDADPMGVVEYGDANALDEAGARRLLGSLQDLAARDPNFFDWRDYSLKSLMQPVMLPEVRTLIGDPAADTGLRLLLVGAVKGSPIAESLRSDLRVIVLDANMVFVLRDRAMDALTELGGEDWPELLDALYGFGDEDSIRLALGIVADVGLTPFSDPAVVDLVVGATRRESRVGPLFARLERRIPDSRLAALLDEYGTRLAGLDDFPQRPGDDYLSDFAYRLVARALATGACEASRVLAWLRPFDLDSGTDRGTREDVDRLIREDERLRRAGQRLVLIEDPGPAGMTDRVWSLTNRSAGFEPTPDDLVVLLGLLDPDKRDDDRIEGLLRTVRHSASEGVEVREAAKRLVAGRPRMVAWIDELARPDVPEWEIRQQERKRRRETERAARREADRRGFAARIDFVRRGEWGIIEAAKVYFGLTQDLRTEGTPWDRLAEWLGQELAEAATEGFEVFLRSDRPPTATQVAERAVESIGYAESMVVVAALAERVRDGRGFEGVDDDRLVTGFFELRRTRIDHHARIESLKPSVEEEMAQRGLVRGAVRTWIELQLLQGREHVDQLRSVLRDDVDEASASELATEWLDRFPDMSLVPETEMIDLLVASRRYVELRYLADARSRRPMSTERRRNWDAVAFLNRAGFPGGSNS